MQVTKTRLAGFVGAGALVALGVAGAFAGGKNDDAAVAGSDHSPSTTRNQPSVPDMNNGQTATWAPPATTASSMSVAPTVKAG